MRRARISTSVPTRPPALEHAGRRPRNRRERLRKHRPHRQSVLWEDRPAGSLMSAGVVVSLPTASDQKLDAGQSTLMYMQPFTGFILTSGDLYFQGSARSACRWLGPSRSCRSRTWASVTTSGAIRLARGCCRPWLRRWKCITPPRSGRWTAASDLVRRFHRQSANSQHDRFHARLDL